MKTPLTIAVTGCASGLGLELVDTLAGFGHNLMATDIDQAKLEQLSLSKGWNPEKVITRFHDVRDPANWEAILSETVNRWGEIDALINVAGVLKSGYLHELTPEQVDLHLDINTKGVIFGTRAAATRMVRQGYGHIINISSMAGLAPIPGISLYTASKFAVRGFSLAVSQELRSFGVKVTVIYPDAIHTPMLQKELNRQESAIVFSSPKVLTTEEVVKVIIKKVLPRKPLEVSIPASRGLLARFVNLFPGLLHPLAPVFIKIGLMLQKKQRKDWR